MYNIQLVTFVCVSSIGVKSKYGSCNGNCTGMIIINIFNRYKGINPTGSNPEKDNNV